MKNTIRFSAILALAAAAAFAQPPGPPPGGFGGHGFGGPDGPGFGGPGFGGPGFMFMERGGTPVTGAPYSGTEVRQFQQTLPGGNQISRTEQSKVFRDSQGRVRVEHTRTNPNTQSTETFVSIFDPVAGASYMLNPSKKSAMTMQLPAARGGAKAAAPAGAPRGAAHEAHARPDGAQIAKTDLGTQTINGVPATGTRVTETIPAGAIGNAQPIQIVRESWVATDLKVPVQITTSDPRMGTTTMQLTNITKSEPDAALFQVPSDYATTARTAGPRAEGMRRHGPPPPPPSQQE